VQHPLPLLLALAASVAGCGDDPLEAPRAPVQLTLSAPRDGGTTGEATVEVVGSVVPANARVIVRGSQVLVDGGGFSRAVELREGSNVIDVGASSPGMRTAWRALRVTRRSRVRVPELVGSEEDAARTALDELGLKVRVVNDDDLLDAFRRRPTIVCSTDPPSGTQVEAGAEVEIVVSKTC